MSDSTMPTDEPRGVSGPESDRLSRLAELIDGYRAQQAALLAQQLEVERRRDAVRTAAEGEASEILATARREVRRVLVRTRRELLVLAAQLQAAGCETPVLGAGRPGPVPPRIEDRTAHAEPPPDPLAIVHSRVVDARRDDVRDVLTEARAELAKLSEDAARLRRVVAETPLALPHDEPPPEASGEAPRFVGASSSVAARPVEEAAEGRPVTASAAAPSSAAPSDAQDAVLRSPMFRDLDEPAPPGTFDAVPAPRGRGSAVVRVAAAAAAALLVGTAVLWAVGIWPRAAPAGPAAETANEPADVAVPVSDAGPPPDAAGEPPVPAARTGLSLVLETRRPSWMRINIDGAADAGRTYAEGTRREITADQEVVIRAGDAGAVLVSVGGAPAEPFGPDGRAVTRRFALDLPAPAADPAALAPGAAAEAGRDAAVGEPGLAAAAGAGTPGGPSAPPAAEVAEAEREILRRHEQWFDAFQRGDHSTMAALSTGNFSLVDERPERERTPSGETGVERTIEDVRIDVAGVGAVLSARVTESAVVGGTPRRTVSMLSEVWIRRDNEWQLMGVRLVPLSALSTAAR